MDSWKSLLPDSILLQAPQRLEGSSALMSHVVRTLLWWQNTISPKNSVILYQIKLTGFTENLTKIGSTSPHCKKQSHTISYLWASRDSIYLFLCQKTASYILVFGCRKTIRIFSFAFTYKPGRKHMKEVLKTLDKGLSKVANPQKWWKYCNEVLLFFFFFFCGNFSKSTKSEILIWMHSTKCFISYY